MITLNQNINYVAIFLTFNCNLSCKYCINLAEKGSSRKSLNCKPMSVNDWITALNKINTGREDLPLTLQGGEPTLHKGFIDIVNGIKDEVNLDLLTNFMFNVDEFIANISPAKFSRKAKYASIRASYHPKQNDIVDLLTKEKKMRDAGFYVGIYSLITPDNRAHIMEVSERCAKEGVDFRIKEYLGFDGKSWHGIYKYPEAIRQEVKKYCECKTTELLIGPNGSVYRCHSDLYGNRNPVGHILDPNFEIQDRYRPCHSFGHCNPCDIKIKTNRFQEYGHTSVDIRNIQDLDNAHRTD